MTGKTLRFIKGHGTANDFVLLPDPDATLGLSGRDVARLCDRRTGIGADGLLRIVRSAAHPDAAAMADRAEGFMDYWNPDGTTAQMCGNGIRLFARYLVDTGLAAAGTFAIATRAGVRQVHVPADPADPRGVRVLMGRPNFPGPDGIEVFAGTRHWPALHVDIGNPHAVALVDDLAHPGDLRTAPIVEPAHAYPHAYPHGVTVEFVLVQGPGHLARRVHERGAGETRSCGTGACAAVAAVRRQAAHPAPADRYAVDVPGGRLHVAVRSDEPWNSPVLPSSSPRGWLALCRSDEPLPTSVLPQRAEVGSGGAHRCGWQTGMHFPPVTAVPYSRGFRRGVEQLGSSLGS